MKEKKGGEALMRIRNWVFLVDGHGRVCQIPIQGNVTGKVGTSDG